MSENSSDSESSCGWTIINHEGSDVEVLSSDKGEAECISQTLTNQQVDKPFESQAKGTECTEPKVENLSASIISEDKETLSKSPNEELADDNAVVGATSDDSDIVTLESPLMEDLQTNQEATEEAEAESINDDEMNLGSSSSSQYTFAPPETVSAFEGSIDESSSDDTSGKSSPNLRKRRIRKRTLSTESEEKPRDDVTDGEQQQQQQHRFNTTLNKCILLALVVAFSMGFGHFYGTTQIQEQQKMVKKFHEDELNDVKDDLFQCQKDQEANADNKAGTEEFLEDEKEDPDMLHSLTEQLDNMRKENQQLREKQAELQSQGQNLETRLKQTVDEKLSVESQQQMLAKENQRMKESLEHEERALSLLQSELRKLREQIRTLEGKGTDAEIIITENQKLKDHLEEEKQQVYSFLQQKGTLVTEAQLLRKELDKEREITDALRKELDSLSHFQTSANTDQDGKNTEGLQTRLAELQKKLDFEQQRSDLWERLYIEAKEEKKDPELKKTAKQQERKTNQEFYGNRNKKHQPKGNFIRSFKNTFDAVKNSTKEFVRHHKEKIKLAKEAVKENLRRFSDSVKSTFRTFQNSAKNLFHKNKKCDKAGDAKTERHNEHPYKPNRHKKHGAHRGNDYKHQYKTREATHEQFYYSNSRKPHKMYTEESRKFESGPSEHDHLGKRAHYKSPKGCSGVFECAHQESLSLFNKVLDPIKVEDFHKLLHNYFQKEMVDFQRWSELEKFINRFFHNGLFIHDQMLFSDFVNDVEDYLEDIAEHQEGNDDGFDDLDGYIYQHLFGDNYLNHFGPSPLYGPDKYRKHASKNAYGSRPARPERKQQACHHRECKWNKPGRGNGRHMANVEIELGPMPFDPKY
ncbi:cell cycle progression protein 1 isoform X2 [Hypanus sabinus]|uniref:cell cycle progression protein 1 isoform X2 n=1 Tax=Hypanus sabinus TaxID=79690 RepID=UPI0028C3775B|nr:cell cycle progression protein 1 isoform X2 [Hypanus sabinus]